MYNDVRLFINGIEVEFNEPPQILYNYNVTDFTNPTIVQNSFSKSLIVEGTQRNNDLFGHIYQLDRVQGDGAFNPIKRAPFELFVNGDKYESGYARLNNVHQEGYKREYEIQLFGGLGSLFYSLSYLGENSNKPLTLADIPYLQDGRGTEPNLDFVINKDTVKTAWTTLEESFSQSDANSKWNVLNFAVTSEGIPKDFDAKKVLVNLMSDYTQFTHSVSGYSGYLDGGFANNGYALGEANQELTCDNAFDLRSYLLRPVIKVSRIFDAIKNPDINGGFEIDLDDHFFDATQNPYYGDAFLTLPMLRDLDIENTNSGSVTGSLVKSNEHRYVLNYETSMGGSVKDISFDVNLTFSASNNTNTYLYTNRKLTTGVDRQLFGSNVLEQNISEGVFVQVWLWNQQDEFIGRSKTYLCASSPYQADGSDLRSLFTPSLSTDIEYVRGKFRKSGNTYVFVDDNNTPINLHFSVNVPKTTKITLWVEKCYTNRTDFNSLSPRWDDEIKGDSSALTLYTATSIYNHTNMNKATAEGVGKVTGVVNFTLANIAIDSETDSSLFSGAKITKDKLLATPFTVADFLLSYCKQFGLYFFKDPTEVSDEPDLYPNGVIHIVDRDTFYTDEYVNLQEYIDRGRPMDITPAIAESKWYEFGLEEIGSEAQEKYLESYGYPYGHQLVNTSMNFNNDTSQLYETNVLKSGVMVQEKNRYFNYSAGYPVYVLNGFKYQLFKTDGADIAAFDLTKDTVILNSVAINEQGYDYYDSMPKLQVHSKNLEAGDGAYVLLFCNEFKSMVSEGGQVVNYYLTDDLQEMADLNDGQPCWIATLNSSGDDNVKDSRGRTIAYEVSELPYFTRDLDSNGSIIHSWNFGHPQETYVPNTTTTSGDCIYDKCWREYIRDLYNVDTRKLSCYVRLLGKPNPSMLRRWYWFDNAIWRINSIKDWNISSLDPTLVEFVKVQDVADYALPPIVKRGSLWIVLDSYSVPATGGTVTGTVYLQDPSEHWYLGEAVSWTNADGAIGSIWGSDIVSPTGGTGASTNITINFPANTSGVSRTFRVDVEDTEDRSVSAYVSQAASANTYLYFYSTGQSITQNAWHSYMSFVANGIDPSSYSVTVSDTAATASVVGNTVEMTIPANTGAQRTFTVTLYGSTQGGDILSTSAVITQAAGGGGGTYLNVQYGNIEFDFFEGPSASQTDRITTDGGWTITQPQ